MDKTLILMALVGTLSLWILYALVYLYERKRKGEVS